MPAAIGLTIGTAWARYFDNAIDAFGRWRGAVGRWVALTSAWLLRTRLEITSAKGSGWPMGLSSCFIELLAKVPVLTHLAFCFVTGDEMQSDTTVRTGRRRWLRFLAIALAVLGTAPFAWQIVSIQLRLSRNGAITRRLVESLHARFSGLEFSGAASYEREVIYIRVVDRVDEATRGDVERWLRGRKIERKIVPAIWLRFSDDTVEATQIE